MRNLAYKKFEAPMGMAAVDSETRKRVSRLGGKARAKSVTREHIELMTKRSVEARKLRAKQKENSNG